VSGLKLRQPIVAYERNDDPDKKTTSRYVFPWPADLVVMYQREFIEDFALNRAWLEIPSSTFPILVDTVRTGVLRFALDLKDELGEVGDNIEALPREEVDRQSTVSIFGGANVVSSSVQNFTQIGSVTGNERDLIGLQTALKTLGASDSDVAEVHTALAEDQKAASAPSLGQRTKAWLTGIGARIVEAGGNIAMDTAKTEATKYLLQYLGLS